MYAPPRHVPLMGSVLLIACASSVSRGDSINILSQTHRGWGNIEEVSYDISGGAPVSGGDSKYVTSDGEGLVTMSSGTLGSDSGMIVADALISSGGPYLISNETRAEVVYDFMPTSGSLALDFAGACGEHWFESGLYYLLEDLTAAFTVDDRLWEYEIGAGWIGDSLPYAGAYAVIPAHTYRLTVGAYAQLGDGRIGTAHVETTITPEPAAISLMLLGALGVAARRR